MTWMLVGLIVATVCLLAIGILAVVSMVRLGRELRRRDHVTATLLEHQFARGSGTDLSD